MMDVTRLISAAGTEIMAMKPMDLKRSILKSEGRVVMGQHLLFAGKGLVHNVTNTEMMFAFGADMVMLNTIDLDDMDNNPGLQGLSIPKLKEICRRPIGVYLGCPKAELVDAGKRCSIGQTGCWQPMSMSKSASSLVWILSFLAAIQEAGPLFKM